MEKEDVKPCPYCGSEMIGIEEDQTGTWCAICWVCASGFGYVFNSESEALTAWNERKGIGKSGAL